MAKKKGRPKKRISWPQFDKLCGWQCTLLEMSEWFGVSEDTIERRVKEKFGVSFADVFSQKRCVGKVSLRRDQFRLAQKHPAMAIFLGKNYLDQKDNKGGSLVLEDVVVSFRAATPKDAKVSANE